jgi:SAM-dependent methyltransferase
LQVLQPPHGWFANENLGRLAGYLRHPLRACLSKLNDWRIGGLLGRPVTIEKSMIETYETNKNFDLVVMINVLEHCQNAAAVLKKVDQILLPEGIFVYHDKMYKAAEVERLLSVSYDAGHPLRVDQSMIEEFLSKHFEPLMRAEYLVHAEFHGLRTSYREIYFIGQKHQATLSVYGH